MQPLLVHRNLFAFQPFRATKDSFQPDFEIVTSKIISTRLMYLRFIIENCDFVLETHALG